MLFSFYRISKYSKCDISGTLCWLPSEVSIADLPSTVMSTRELCASCPSLAFSENYARVVTAAFHVGLPTILSYCAVYSELKVNRISMSCMAGCISAWRYLAWCVSWLQLYFSASIQLWLQLVVQMQRRIVLMLAGDPTVLVDSFLQCVDPTVFANSSTSEAEIWKRRQPR